MQLVDFVAKREVVRARFAGIDRQTISVHSKQSRLTTQAELGVPRGDECLSHQSIPSSLDFF